MEHNFIIDNFMLHNFIKTYNILILKYLNYIVINLKNFNIITHLLITFDLFNLNT